MSIDKQVEYNVYEDVFYEDAFQQETKFYDHNYIDEEAQNSDFVKTHFLTKLVQSYRCRFCNVNFVFNNQLHKHLRIIYNKFRFSIKEAIVINFESVNKFIVIISTTKTFSLIAFHVSKVIHSNVIDVTIEEYVFREHRFVTILIMFVLTK